MNDFEKEGQPVEEIDMLDPLQFQPSGRGLLDLVLLAIIDGNPLQDARQDPKSVAVDREKRLVEAKRALIGNAARVGNVRTPDRRALMWMAVELQKQAYAVLREEHKRYDELPFEVQSRTNRPMFLNFDLVEIAPLARAAADRFYPGTTNSANRLEKKFRANRRGLIERIDEFDATNQACYDCAVDFCKLLELTGLSVEHPTDTY